MQTQLTTVTQKGQVTIPVEVRRLLRLNVGDQVRFVVGVKKEVKIKPAKRISIMHLYGSLKSKVHPKLSGQKLIEWEKRAWSEAVAEKELRILRSYSKRK